MRNITCEVVGAFNNRQSKKLGNTSSTGTQLLLHGNMIAEYRPDGLYVTMAGWNTPTTRARLNGITGVKATQKASKPYINGNRVGTAQWVKV